MGKITSLNYWKEFSRFERPDMLVLLKEPKHYTKEELLVGTTDFISKSCIPFVKWEGNYYKADLLEAIPDKAIGMVGSCRKYVKTTLPEGVPDFCIYKFE